MNEGPDNGTFESPCCSRAVSTAHEQVWAKVNVPVDRGVLGLVNALSEFPGLETVESCEGCKDQPAWVCFRFGRYWEREHAWRELAEFVLDFLAPRLTDRVGDATAVVIRASHWGAAMADITVRSEAKEKVETVLRELAVEFSEHRHHSLACCGGSADTSR